MKLDKEKNMSTMSKEALQGTTALGFPYPSLFVNILTFRCHDTASHKCSSVSCACLCLRTLLCL